MDIRPIRTEEDNVAARRRIDALRGAPKGTSEGDELDILIALVERYEQARRPTPCGADPVAFLLAFMERSGRTQRDLAELFGSRSRASEALNRRRPLTLGQIRLLHAKWGVPSDCLIGELDSA